MHSESFSGKVLRKGARRGQSSLSFSFTHSNASLPAVQDILRNLVVPCEENPLPVSELEIDEFQFHYTTSERPHIQNDTITINHRFANDHIIKLSISHALSQVSVCAESRVQATAKCKLRKVHP